MQNQDAIDGAFDLVGDDSTKTPYTERITQEAKDEEPKVEEPKEVVEEETSPDSDDAKDEGGAEEVDASSNNFKDWMSIVEDEPTAIRQVPKRKQTDAMVIAAVVDDGSGKARPKLTDKGIAKARLNADVFKALLQENPWRIDEVPAKKLNRALVKVAIENCEGHPEVLERTPERFRTKPIYTLAVDVEPKALQFVPDDIKNRKMCKSAVERDFTCIQFVPKGFIGAKERKVAEKELHALEVAKAEEEAKAKAEAEAKAKAEREAKEAKAKAHSAELAKTEDTKGIAASSLAKSVASKFGDEVASLTGEASGNVVVEVTETVTVKTQVSVPKDVAENLMRRKNPLRVHFQLVHEG